MSICLTTLVVLFCACFSQAIVLRAVGRVSEIKNDSCSLEVDALKTETVIQSSCENEINIFHKNLVQLFQTVTLHKNWYKQTYVKKDAIHIHPRIWWKHAHGFSGPIFRTWSRTWKACRWLELMDVVSTSPMVGLFSHDKIPLVGNDLDDLSNWKEKSKICE